MSSSLLLQQCLACLVPQTWMVLEMGGRWPYSCYIMESCFQYLFNRTDSQSNHIYIYIYIYIWRLPWGLSEVVRIVQQVHCSRRRLLRRGREFHVCTINKNAHMKKVWKLIVYTLYIYIYMKVKVKLATIVKGDYKASFSLATTWRCRKGHNSFFTEFFP